MVYLVMGAEKWESSWVQRIFSTEAKAAAWIVNHPVDEEEDHWFYVQEMFVDEKDND